MHIILVVAVFVLYLLLVRLAERVAAMEEFVVLMGSTLGDEIPAWQKKMIDAVSNTEPPQ